MINRVKRAIKTLLSAGEEEDYQSITFSQEGEDVLIPFFLRNVDKGIYVDVGAHHPFRFSNTALLYSRGWRGINIDPLPGVKELFDQHRPNDINLNCGIGPKHERLAYYMFGEPALNTFSTSQVAVRKQQGIHTIKEIAVETYPLGEVLEKYLKGKDISLLTIDAMDYDYEVLRSNVWDLFKPKLIIVHDDSGDLKFSDVSAALQTRTCQFLMSQNYSLVAKAYWSSFFLYHGADDAKR
jgi:FkbM family methyltransferase